MFEERACCVFPESGMCLGKRKLEVLERWDGTQCRYLCGQGGAVQSVWSMESPWHCALG